MFLLFIVTIKKHDSHTVSIRVISLSPFIRTVPIIRYKVIGHFVPFELGARPVFLAPCKSVFWIYLQLINVFIVLHINPTVLADEYITIHFITENTVELHINR